MDRSESKYLQHLQTKTCLELRHHVSKNADNDKNGNDVPPEAEKRMYDLLLLLPCLRSFNKQLLVELFFSGLIGNVQVENVIPFILKMDVLQIFGTKQSSENGDDKPIDS